MVVFGAESPEVLRTPAAGDSSPSSAESSFRQIDDVFLQTQTRIWIGEVLQTRLNEQLSIADLLADGELLFEVSRVIWKMKLTKRMELKCVKSYDYVPFTSRNSGRYMPYSKIDSFLKICKVLGLAGIDLFSPSDVVEKRDTRRVCTCIRSLSKKARSWHFNVPDFDVVTYTVAMPKDMVGYIRRSWEMSHCGYSSYSHSPCQTLRQRSRQKHPNAISGSCNLYIEEFDDVESKFVLQSDSSATIFSYDPYPQMSTDLINSPEVSSEVKNNLSDRCSVQFDVKEHLGDECIQCQEDSEHLIKVTRSLFSHHLEDGHHQHSIPSSSFDDLSIQLGGRVFNAETGAIRTRNSDEIIISGQIYNDPILEDDASVVDSCECSISKTNIINYHGAISAITSDEICNGNSVLHDGEDCISDACVGAGSCCSKASRTLENEFTSRYLDGDISEVSSIASVSPLSSTASMHSVSVTLKNLDYDDHSDTEDAFKNVWFPESENSKFGGLSKKQTGESKSQNAVEYETTGLILATNNGESLFEGEGMDAHFYSLMHFLTNSDKYTTGDLDSAISCDNRICKSQINSDVNDEGKVYFAGQSCFSLGFPQWDQKGKNRIAVVPTGASPLSLSLVESHRQHLQLIQTEVKGDVLLQKKTESVIGDNYEEQSITIVKSDLDAGKQKNKCCPVASSDNVIHGKHEDSNASCDVVLVETENVNKDEVKNENLQKSAVEDSDGAESPSIGIAKSKPQKRPILKSVVKGTAVVGALVFLLHFRKNGRDKSGWSHKQPKGTNSGDVLSAKEQKRHGANGVYPAEKLKL